MGDARARDDRKGEEGPNDGAFGRTFGGRVTTADLHASIERRRFGPISPRIGYVGIARIVGRLFGIRRPLFIAYRCQTPGTISGRDMTVARIVSKSRSSAPPPPPDTIRKERYRNARTQRAGWIRRPANAGIRGIPGRHNAL